MSNSEESSERYAPQEERVFPRARVLFFNADNPEYLNIALDLREEIFIKGQNVDPEIERDQYDATARHGVLEHDGQPVGVVRMRDVGDGVTKVERVGVLEESRKAGLGRYLMELAETAARNEGAGTITLNAQSYVREWYEKLGYTPIGETFLEAGIEHQRMTKAPGWRTVERPGYAGAKRDERHRGYDNEYGFGRWRTAWSIDGRYMDRAEAYQLYEDAYYEFFRENPDVFDTLIREASDVYDDAPSNVDSGFDYFVQETNRTHLQDVAIRRCVRRLGHAFQGTELIQIRSSEGQHPLSRTLSPGSVPFHQPEYIAEPRLEGWWKADTVEDFYQSNKILQVQQ